MFPCFVIGLVFRLLLPTPTIWFSQDRKRNVSDGVVSRVGRNGPGFCRAYDSAYNCDFLFSLGHKRSYDSAYDSDSDSVASENRP